MRHWTATGLAGFVFVLASCNSATPPTTSPSTDYWTEERLDEAAGKFNPNPVTNTSLTSEQIPNTFIDSEGNAVSLAAFRKKQNVLLVVVKGVTGGPQASFCPGCLTQTHALATRREEFAKRDTQIFILFPSPKEQVADFLKQAKVAALDGSAKIPFPVLVDADSKAVTALGVTNRLNNPSTFLLDKEGSVVFAYVGGKSVGGDLSFDRPSVDALLAQVEKINPKK